MMFGAVRDSESACMRGLQDRGAMADLSDPFSGGVKRTKEE